ncbi:ABC transporter ATP-binding protein [Dactylosporangium sp. NPDC005572]|uniref:ABC transporter ATP-binding protein n=1 Tax=Dactylosporangium sp. NPDC005572 TaxID=3156889 RepID=UPI0033A7BF9A
MSTLVVDDLRVSVTGTDPYDIVSGVSFELAAGSVLGLVGESGSGKTTTSLALLGFARSGTRISGGSVTIDGTEMVDTTEAARRKARGHLVSYVPQDPMTAMNPALSIGEQLVEMLGSTRRERRNADVGRITDLLEKVHLPGTTAFLKRYPHQLSGGQLQRVSIAMAIINRPRLIVFDEPTTGLDVTTQAHVLDTIEEVIGTEGSAAVYVTHDLTVVDRLADRIGVMYAGSLVEYADARTVLHRSAHPYSRRLVLATPDVRERRQLVGIPGTVTHARDRSTGCAFLARCQFAEAACGLAAPPAVELGPDHLSRCFRAGFVEQQRLEQTSGAQTWRTHATREKPLLQVAGLYVRYGDHQVVHGIDLAVAPGECVALVGESGSGKTSTARAISGLHDEAVEGWLGYQGDRVGWTAKERDRQTLQDIQYIFQNPYASLNPRRTIGWIIEQPLRTFGLCGSAKQRRAEVRRLLAQVSLPAQYEHRRPSQLSGGERQRVAIARAMAARPRVLICDEITSALDVSIQASILELLGQLRATEDLTTLFITHNIAVVRAIADRIVILKDGVIVEQGEAQAVLDKPTHEYTRELVDNTPTMKEPV